MAKGVDDLLRFLVQQVALQSRFGASTDYVIDAVSRFYNSPDTPDRAFLDQVWLWLIQHPDVHLAAQPEAEHKQLTLTEVESSNATREDEAEIDQDHEQPPLRLFASEEQIWQALTGHGVDHRKISALEFAILAVLATYQDEGVLQPDLVLQTGQDKRSLPGRTTELAEKGYIVKRTVHVPGKITSRCILKCYASDYEQNLNKSVDRESWTWLRFGKWLDIIKEALGFIQERGDKGIFWQDLKASLNLIRERAASTKTVLDALERFDHLKCIQLARTTGKQRDDGRINRILALRFKRKVTETDWTNFWAMGEEFTRSRRKSRTKNSASTIGDDDDLDEDEAGPSIDRESNMAGRTSFATPTWDPDRTLIDLGFSAVRDAGTTGITSSESVTRVCGKFFVRPLASLLVDMSNVIASQRFLASHHLQIVRDAKQFDRYTAFTFYTFDAFQTLVETEGKSWADIGKSEPKDAVPGTFDFAQIPEKLFFREGCLLALDDPIQSRLDSAATRAEYNRRTDPGPDIVALVPVKRKARTANAQPSKLEVPVHVTEVPKKKFVTHWSRLELLKIDKPSERWRLENGTEVLRSYHMRMMTRDLRAYLEAGENPTKWPEEFSLDDLEHWVHSLRMRLYALMPTQTSPGVEVKLDVLDNVAAPLRRAFYRPSLAAHTIQHLAIEGKRRSGLGRKGKAAPKGRSPKIGSDQDGERDASVKTNRTIKGRTAKPAANLPFTKVYHPSVAAHSDFTYHFLPHSKAKKASNRVPASPSKSNKARVPPRKQTKILLPALERRAPAAEQLPGSDNMQTDLAELAHPLISRTGRERKLTTKALNHGTTVPTTIGRHEEEVESVPLPKKSSVGALTYQQQYASAPREQSPGVYLGPPCTLKRDLKGRGKRSRLAVFRSPKLYRSARVDEPPASTTDLAVQPSSMNLDDLEAPAPHPHSPTSQLLVADDLSNKSSASSKRTRKRKPSYPDHSDVPQDKRVRTGNYSSAGVTIGHETAADASLGDSPIIEAVSRLGNSEQATSGPGQSADEQEQAEAVPAIESNAPSNDGKVEHTMNAFIAQPRAAAAAAAVPASKRSLGNVSGLGNTEQDIQVANGPDVNTVKPDARRELADDSPTKANRSDGAMQIPLTPKRKTDPRPQVPSKAQHGAGGGVSRFGGSLLATRRKLVLEIIKKNDGVFPGNKEMFYPFATLWSKTNPNVRPDGRTIAALMKQLVNDGTLQEYTFNFETNSGMKMKKIVVLPGIVYTDSRVQALKESMKAAHPYLWIPPTVDVDPTLRQRTSEALLAAVDRSKAEARAKAWRDENLPQSVSREEFNEKRDQLLKAAFREDAGANEEAIEDEEEDDSGGNSDALEYENTPGTITPLPRRSSTIKKAVRLTRKAALEQQKLQKAKDLLGEPTFAVEGYRNGAADDLRDTLRREWRQFDSTMQPSNARLTSRSMANTEKDAMRIDPAYIPMSRGRSTQHKQPDGSDGSKVGSEAQRQERLAAVEAINRLGQSNFAEIYTPSAAAVLKPTASRSVQRPLLPTKAPLSMLPGPRPRQLYSFTKQPGVQSVGANFKTAQTSALTQVDRIETTQRYSHTTGTFGTFLQVPAWFTPTSLDDIFQRRAAASTKLRPRDPRRLGRDAKLDRTLQIIQQWELEDPGALTLSSCGFINVVPEVQIPVHQREIQTPKPQRPRIARIASIQGRPTRDEEAQAHHVRQTTEEQSNSRRVQDVEALKRRGNKVDLSLEEPDPKRRKVRHGRRRPRDPHLDKRILLAVTMTKILYRAGDSRFVNWDAVMRLLGNQCTESEIRQRYNLTRTPWKAWVTRAKRYLEERFLAAYEVGEVPSIDFVNPVLTDWVKIMEWVEKQQQLVDELPNKSHEQPLRLGFSGAFTLPKSRAWLDASFEVKASNIKGTFDPYEIKLKGVRTGKRRDWQHEQPDVIPLGASRPNRQVSMTTVARSWVRAAAVSDDIGYDTNAAQSKLMSVPEMDIDTAYKEMFSARAFTMIHKGETRPERNVDLSYNFLAKTRMNLELGHHREASAYKSILDMELGNGQKTSFKPSVADGEMMALVNLWDSGQISLHAREISSKPFGMLEGNYKTRSVDKNLLQFAIDIKPTTTYTPGFANTGLPPKPVVQKQRNKQGLDITPLPVWVDIQNRIAHKMWRPSLNVLFFLCTVRPGLQASRMAEYVEPYLEGWELGLLMKWAVDAGLAQWVTRKRSGIQLRPCWWLWFGMMQHEE